MARSLPFWHSDIAAAVCRGRRVLVAAHGNSLRGIVKHLDRISDQVGGGGAVWQCRSACMAGGER